MQLSTRNSLLLAALAAASSTEAFVVRPAPQASLALYADTDKAAEAVFVAPDDDNSAPEEDEDMLTKAEQLGRGAAKVRSVACSMNDCMMHRLIHSSLPITLTTTGQTRQTQGILGIYSSRRRAQAKLGTRRDLL